MMNSELTQAIHNALCVCFGLAPDSAQALSMIRRAYTEPENSSRPARTADVIYWSLSPEAGEDPAAYNAANAGGGSHVPTVHRYLAYQLLIVCYGSGCEACAHRIRSFLYLDGTGLPRQILRRAGIYPVPDPPAPQLLYEPEGSLWRRRADLTVSLRVKDTLVCSSRRNAIESAPVVTIIR